MSSNLIGEVAHLAAGENDLQGLTRPLLELMERVTGLHSTYLTEIDFERGVQEILYSRNTGSLDIPEGLEVAWEDTVCRLALESGVTNTANVPEVFPESMEAKALGIQTYVSVAIRTRDEEIFGTLCGASDSSIEVDDGSMEIFHLFATLIAHQVDRERLAAVHQERAEVAEERLRSRALFLAQANHMLKTPLTVIKAWAGLLVSKRGSLDPEQMDNALRIIEDRADELARQVDDLLDEARTEVLASEQELLEIQIEPILQRSAEGFGAHDSHPISVSAEESVVAVADAPSLDQILGHLIENAIKYSPEGGPIELRAAQEGPIVVIAVRDAGKGLPLDTDPFEPFARGTEEPTRGVGLGLHIVKNLVEAMGGRVSGERNPDRGSTFTIRLRSPQGSHQTT